MLFTNRQTGTQTNGGKTEPPRQKWQRKSRKDKTSTGLRFRTHCPRTRGRVNTVRRHRCSQWRPRRRTSTRPLTRHVEIRRLKADLIMRFKILKGFTNIDPSEFFTPSTCNTRGHSMKLYYPDSRVLARQNFFSVRVVQVWNNYLPNEIVSANCVSAFKSLLNSIHVSFFNVVF